MGNDALSPTQRELLATRRWAWLAPFVDVWFADPLDAADGSTPDQIAEAAGRTGLEVPVLLAEWWSLVGTRLQPVQDIPARPDNIQADGDTLSLWTENQGVWTISVATSTADGLDGVCVVEGDPSFPWPTGVTVPQAAQAMLLSETIAGSWFDDSVGPLGPLRGEVAGGYLDDLTPRERSDVERTLPMLDVIANPFWKEPPRGDTTVVVRLDPQPEMGEWMTATAAARNRLGEIVDLNARPG